ncbi:MAG: methionine sulfoxide reductase [Phycisphaerae bacterium]|nr:methionine sulfoxide reductase [Phycisphaerae bacterium]
MTEIAHASAGGAEDTGPRYSKSGYDVTPLTSDEIKTLAKNLTDEQRQILLRKGTEPAFCGNLLDNKKHGVYVCALCELPLFGDEAKFDSGTGWPSYDRPIDPAHVAYHEDKSHFMTRTEITCARCNGHLGHVFNDGPTDTNQRYCLNSASLKFYEDGEKRPARSQPVKTETAYFAGGCFWGVEDRFQNVPGVIDAVSGYQGGTKKDPTYKDVCYTETGHAESVRVTFDPARVSYRELLEGFFRIHNPTTLNRQGPDVGTQYRSAIFATDDKQYEQAKAYIEELAAKDRYKGREIVTQVNHMAPFYEAEDYHQDYNAKTGHACGLPAWDS